MEENLAKEKRELAETARKAAETGGQTEPAQSESALDMRDMPFRARQRYKRAQEAAKLRELSFWRRIQYILTYYFWKFAAVAALCAVLVIVVRQVYIATRPVALDLVVVNDSALDTDAFTASLESLYEQTHEVPEDAVYRIDTNIKITPTDSETYTSGAGDMAYYSKMLSLLESESTQIILCDAPVVDYYAVDGYLQELQHNLPEEIFARLQEENRLYTCDGPVEDSDYYAIDITGTAFVKQTGIQLDTVYLCIPTILSDENRALAYDFVQMILDLEDDEATK